MDTLEKPLKVFFEFTLHRKTCVLLDRTMAGLYLPTLTIETELSQPRREFFLEEGFESRFGPKIRGKRQVMRKNLIMQDNDPSSRFRFARIKVTPILIAGILRSKARSGVEILNADSLHIIESNTDFEDFAYIESEIFRLVRA